MPASPLCEIRHGANPFVATGNGFDAPANSTVTVKLADTSLVSAWYLEIFGTDELSAVPSMTGVNGVTHLVTTPSTQPTLTFPNATGRTLLFRSTVTPTSGPNISTTFGVFSLTDGNERCGAVGETRESHITYGWVPRLNRLLRGPTAVDLRLAGQTSGDLVYFNGTNWVRINGGTVNNNAAVWVRNSDTKYKPRDFTGHIDASAAQAYLADLVTVVANETYTVDAYVSVQPSSPGAATIAAWKLSGLFYGAAGPIATISGAVNSTPMGGGTGVFVSPPTLIVDGATKVQLQYTNPDGTARTVGFEGRIGRLAF